MTGQSPCLLRERLGRPLELHLGVRSTGSRAPCRGPSTKSISPKMSGIGLPRYAMTLHVTNGRGGFACQSLEPRV
jgi:hypothetical protein